MTRAQSSLAQIILVYKLAKGDSIVISEEKMEQGFTSMGFIKASKERKIQGSASKDGSVPTVTKPKIQLYWQLGEASRSSD